MFSVSDFMSARPIVVDGDETISDTLDLMKFHNIHRVPVIGKDGELVGLITEGMIGADQKATSLSIYELNYLLSKTKVKSIMEKNPYFIKENDLMEEAAALLLKQDIGCLPVVNEAGKVVGILTQNDVFKSYLTLLGWDAKGTRLLLNLPDEIGTLEKLTDLLSESEVNIRNISVYDVDEANKKSKVLLKTRGEVSQSLLDALNAQGFEVLESKDFADHPELTDLLQ